MKFSRLELLLNTSVKIIFAIQCMLGLAAALIGTQFVLSVNDPKHEPFANYLGLPIS